MAWRPGKKISDYTSPARVERALEMILFHPFIVQFFFIVYHLYSTSSLKYLNMIIKEDYSSNKNSL